MNEEEKKAADAKAEETKAEETKAEETKAEDKPADDAKAEPTIGEALGEDKKEEDKTSTIPEAAFLDEKKGRKAAEKEVARLKKLIEDGGSQSEITADINSIADEFGVDPKFLTKLTKSIEARVRKETEEEVSSKLKPFEERDRNDRIGKIFNENFSKAMEKMPEFKDIVNPEVIKTLSLDPKNSRKTFTQIIEETYGNALPGKRTIEQTKPAGGKEPGEVDIDKARKDPAYFAEVMSDPQLKKKYNEGLAQRITL